MGTTLQIYEMVMGDVNGNRTTVLERAKTPLKDNRLTPLGFTTTHISYDTTLIAGVPASDIDFNRYSNGTEGSGSDIVHFHVPMYGHSGLIRVVSRVWYQSAPPRYMDEMFALPERAAALHGRDVRLQHTGHQHIPHHVSEQYACSGACEGSADHGPFRWR